jgi:putative ABC transport system permease protein
MEKVREELIGMGFMVSAISDVIEQANKIFRVIQIVLGIFGIIALIVAAIGLANTMTISLLERTQDIGIMRAVGASPKDVRNLFLTESTLIGFAGGVVGIFIGKLVSLFFNLGINLLAKSLGAQPLNLFFTPSWFLIFIVIFSTLVGFSTGIFPARRASKLNPLAALKYK